MNNDFGYTPDYDKIAEYAATLNPGWGDDIAGLAATDDGSDAFLWRGIVACLKNASPTVQARWLLKNTNDYLTISSFNQGNIGCHLPDTEVLTQIGWKLFKDITLLDKLATVNPANSKLYFECPTKIIQGEYKGNIHYYQHKFLDCAVTHNHNMLVRKWNEKKRTLNKEYSFIKAEDIGWYCGLMNRVEYDGEKTLDYYILPAVEHKTRPEQRQTTEFKMDLWLNFLGIYIAEGTLVSLPNEYRIQIAASKDREKTFIKNVLEKLEIHYTEYDDRFVINNKQIFKELENFGLLGVYASKKFVPSFVFTLNNYQIREFLLGHRMGDGSEQHNHWSHYTSSHKLADDLQRLIFLAGYSSYISVRPSRTSIMKDGRIIKGVYPEYRISCNELKKFSIEKKKNITIEHYEGLVYCAEVPTYHTLVTRRNGKILISGNSCVGNGEAMTLSIEEAVDIVCGLKPSSLTCMVSPEACYGLGREAGNMLGRSAGCYGAAVAKSSTTMGTLYQQPYPPTVDLTNYSVTTCRSWGSRGVPAILKPIALQTKLDTSYLIKTVAEAWTLVGAGHPLNQCSNIGFTSMTRDSDGAIKRSGRWSHSMALIGRRTTKTGRKLFICMNSWGDTWASGPLYEDQPPGSFGIDYDTVASAIAQGDVFVKIGMNGLKRKQINWSDL